LKLYYKDGWCTVTQGDCLEVMAKMAEKGLKFDAVITDPPYGTTACKWDVIIPFDKMWEQIHNLKKDRSPILLFGSEPFSSLLRTSNLKEFKYDWIWNKVQGTGFSICKIQPMKNHEIISVFGKVINYFPQMEKRDKEIDARNWKMSKLHSENGNFSSTDISQTQKIYTEKYPNSIITFHKSAKECNNTNRVHPTQKPLDLLEYLIATYTNEGDTILDFTCGSGTTLVAAKKLRRRCYGIETEEKYCEITRNRLMEITR